MPRYSTHHHSGFTLLEVIIAMSIFAIVSLMAYGGLYSVINSKTHTEDALERLQELQLTMRTMSDDFQHISSRSGHDALGGILLPLTTQRSDTLVEFTRGGWRNPASQVRSTLQRVAYIMDDDKLIRRYWSHVDRGDDERFFDRTLITNIESIDVRFLNEKRTWKTDWPSASSLASTTANAPAELPTAVEVTLKMNDWGEIIRLIRLAR